MQQDLERLGVALFEAAPQANGLPTGVCLVLSGRADRAFCSHFGVADCFDATALLAEAGVPADAGLS